MSNRKKKKKNKKTRFSDLNISDLKQHKQNGNVLQPPFNQLPNAATSSWSDDHLPEMLWAALITSVIPREKYLDIFRKITANCSDWFNSYYRSDSNPIAQDEIPVLDLITLEKINDEQFESVLSPPLLHPLGYAALRPLLLIQNLPGIDRWKKLLGVEPTDVDWRTLANAVADTFDHQSEKSTDIRWFKVLLPTVCGIIQFPESLHSHAEDILQFPNKGDLRSVRPSIRAMEMAFRRTPPSAWVDNFWKEVFEKTKCIDSSNHNEYSFFSSKISPKSLYNSRQAIIDGFSTHMNHRRTDPKLDTAFGLVLYALAIIEEIGAHHLSQRITGRLALRALAEANITLRYLVHKNDPNLWSSYRVYGAGQAKLAFLKAQELEDDLPSFIDEESLYTIANEDRWQEFLDIDVGHWSNSNLRAIATSCGAKEIYDKYYGWTSSFSHAHWGAIRDSNFITCSNPLHRLHRIPRTIHRSLNHTEADAVSLANGMISILSTIFPANEGYPSVNINSETDSRQ